MDNMPRNYYYDLSIKEIEEIDKSGKRPILGIHVCCGPCSTFPLEFLAPHFKVVILYANGNIYPSEEYYRRLNELKKYVDVFNKEQNQDVEIVEFTYDNESYNKDLAIYGNVKEGGERCFFCYEKRMALTYKYAEDHNFDYFTTVMTISTQKSSKKMNEIGEKLSHIYKPKYFYSDFKKNKGCDRVRELVKKYNLYNQHYCGCIYSYSEYLEKQRKEEK